MTNGKMSHPGPSGNPTPTDRMHSAPELRRLAIIGAQGQMGGLFASHCKNLGLDVDCLDRPLLENDLEQAIPAADLVLLAVPVPAMEEILARVAPLMRQGAILADVGSVKVAPLRDMRKAWGGPIVGTHPLFGPNPPEEASIAVVPGDSAAGKAADEDACLAVEALIEKMGFRYFRTTAEEHDNAVAQIQGLNFVTTVSYLAALAKQPEIERFLTPSFQRRLEAAQKMLTQDAELFTTLFEQNPYGQDAVRRFRNFLHIAAGGDMDLLVQQASWWWKDIDTIS